jgi:hypothetical protein
VGAIAGCGIAALATTLLANREQVPAGSPNPPQAPKASATAQPERRAPISFQKVALSTDDLVESTNLDIYKFQVALGKGERFRIALRVCESRDSQPRYPIYHLFEKTSDAPATVRVSFMREDRKLSGFLMSNQPRAEFRLDCTLCDPPGIVTIVDNPLGNIDPGRRTVVVCQSDKVANQLDTKEAVLFRAVAHNGNTVRGVDVDGYPRAELMLLRDE